MTSLHLPSRWTRQPQQPVEADWGDPLARTLLSAWTDGFAQTRRGRSVSAFGSRALSKYGVGGLGNGTSSTASLTPGALTCNSGVTFGTRVALVRAGAIGASRTFAGSGSGTNSWRLNSGGTLSLVNVGVQVVYTSAAIVSANEYCALGVSSDATNVRVYKNGVPFATGTTGGTLPNGGANPQLGSDGNSAAFYDGEIYLHLAFDAILSDAQMAELHANPWQIFRPIRNRLYFGTETASGGFKPHFARGANQIIRTLA